MIIMKMLKQMLVVLAVLCTAGAASAQVGSRNLAYPYQAIDKCFVYNVFTAGTDTAINVGSVIATTVFAGTGVTSTPIGGSPWTSRVGITLFDTGANSAALSCTGGTLVCVDQFGVSRSEAIGAISETPTYSTTVCREVTSFVSTGCVNGADTDAQVLFASRYVGLGVKIKTTSDLERLIKYTAASVVAQGTKAQRIATVTGYVAPTSASPSGTPGYYVDVENADAFGTGVAAIDLSHICMTVRPSFK